MTGKEVIFPDIYGKSSEEFTSYLNRIKLRQFAAFRSEGPFGEVINTAWDHLCFAYDQPKIENFESTDELRGSSAFEIYLRVVSDFQDRDSGIKEDDWENIEGFEEFFTSHKYGDKMTVKTFLGAVASEIPYISGEVHKDLSMYGKPRLAALGERFEQMTGKPINDTEDTCSFITYLALLELIESTRKHVIKPILSEIGRLQIPGLQSSGRTDEFIKEKITEIMVESEASRKSSADMEDKIVEIEGRLFGEDADSLGEIWRTVFYSKLHIDKRWQLMELLLKGDYAEAIDRIKGLSISSPRMFPVVMLQEIKEGTWRGYEIAEKQEESIEKAADSVRIGKQVEDPRLKRLALQAGERGIFVAELKGALVSFYIDECDMKEMTARSQAGKAIVSLEGAFSMPWQYELVKEDVEDGLQENMLTLDHISQILSWKNPPRTDTYGMGEITLGRLQQVVRDEFISTDRLPSEKIRDDFPEQRLVFMRERATQDFIEYGGGIFMLELELLTRDFFREVRGMEKKKASTISGAVRMILTEIFREEQYTKSGSLYAGDDPLSRDIFFTALGINEILSWKKLDGLRKQNFQDLKQILRDFVDETETKLPD